MPLTFDLFVHNTLERENNTLYKSSSLFEQVIELFPQTNENQSEAPGSSAILNIIAAKSKAQYIVFQIKPGLIDYGQLFSEWAERITAHKPDWCYGDYFEIKNGIEVSHPVIEYQVGSIRDDFDFGPVVIFKSSLLKQYLEINKENYEYAGWYDFRLWLSRISGPLIINKPILRYYEPDQRVSGQKQFDYVNPANRLVQIEMEKVATQHLMQISAKVSAPFAAVDLNTSGFDTEATVVIPVMNRVSTLPDAIASVLEQDTNFRFNLIVVDNYSTDGTSELLQKIDDPRLVHVIPEQTDLGIGGCWNVAINHKACGKFAIQLDSDDLYASKNTLQQIVDRFYEGNFAMVIGSYRMVNYKLEEIPPGIIDHREWTDENGPNNALRINGLGAPRAFFTPVIQSIGFPNVSYGEDYAVALKISRSYKVGRIYDPIYLCRRWDGNTDANLAVNKTNANNFYKDSLRSDEIRQRQQLEI